MRQRIRKIYEDAGATLIGYHAGEQEACEPEQGKGDEREERGIESAIEAQAEFSLKEFEKVWAGRTVGGKLRGGGSDDLEIMFPDYDGTRF